jgi:hypothetical protein
MKHKHHIKPRYEDGSDSPENLVELSVIQHAMWHYAEWLRKGNWQDDLAFRILTGRITREESIREKVSNSNKSRKGEKRPPRSKSVKEKIQSGMKRYLENGGTPGKPPKSTGRKPKPVELISSDNTSVFVFDSSVQAGKALSLNPSAITKCARGVWKHTGGWQVRFI